MGKDKAPQVQKYLLDVNAQNMVGDMFLHLAVGRGNKEVKCNQN